MQKKEEGRRVRRGAVPLAPGTEVGGVRNPSGIAGKGTDVL